MQMTEIARPPRRPRGWTDAQGYWHPTLWQALRADWCALWERP